MVLDLGNINVTVFVNISMDNNRTATELDYRYLYNNLCIYFLQWYLPLVVAVGTLGGAFCLFFLFMSKLFPKNILVWMVSICVGDFMILIFDALRMLLKIWINYDIRDEISAVCKAHNYFSNFFFYWSAYMQACMSLQRLYFVLQPLKARIHLPFSRVIVIWAIVTTFVALPHLPYLLYWEVQTNGDCEPNDRWYYYVTTVNDLVIWGIIPLVSMTISTSVITLKIFGFKSSLNSQKLSKKNRQTASGDKDDGSPSKFNKTEGGSTEPVRLRRATADQGGRRHGGADNARHVTKLLVSMNMFYMTTTYPLLIYLMHLNFGLKNQVGITIPQPVHKFCYYLLRSLCYLNSSGNWLFYCAAGRVFRQRATRILWQLFCGRCSPGNNAGFELGRRYDRTSSVYQYSRQTILNRRMTQRADVRSYNLPTSPESRAL